MSEDGMDDWAAAMAEQAESEDAEQENDDVQVAELDELTDDAPITQEEKRNSIRYWIFRLPYRWKSVVVK